MHQQNLMKCLRSVSVAALMSSRSPVSTFGEAAALAAGVGVGAVFLRPQARQLCDPGLFRHAVSLLECRSLRKGFFFWSAHQHAAGSSALGQAAGASVAAGWVELLPAFADAGHLFLRRAPLNPRPPVHSGGGPGAAFPGVRSV